MTQELDIRFRRPESYVCSVRLNQAESEALTQAAEFHGMKLSTYIKEQALKDAALPKVYWTIR